MIVRISTDDSHRQFKINIVIHDAKSLDWYFKTVEFLGSKFCACVRACECMKVDN